MHHYKRDRRRELNAIVAVGYAVETVHGDTVKAERCSLRAAVNGVCRPRKRAAAYRRHVHSLPAIVESAEVAQKHHCVCHQVMSERHRLRALHMRISGHYRCAVFGCAGAERFDKAAHKRCDIRALVAQVHPRVKCDLVVSAPCGMQLFTHVADALREHRFDEHMYILSRGIEFKLSRVEVVEYPLEPFRELFGVRRRDYPLCAEHCGMRHAAEDVLAVHFAVKPYRRIEIVRRGVGFYRRSPLPHLFKTRVEFLRSLSFIPRRRSEIRV